MPILSDLTHNSPFILSAAALSGLMIGNISFRRISLGSSGALLSGLVMGIWGLSVPGEYFSWNLILFAVSVGLLAAEDIRVLMRGYGLKFAIISFIVCGIGALSSIFFALLMADKANPHLVAAIYSGALTSSPGLGAALEATGNNPLVTAGYTISYPFGVFAVVLFVQFAPSLFGIDIEKEKAELKKILAFGGEESSKKESTLFSVAAFAMCIALGIIAGNIKIYIPMMGNFSLGSAGGAMIVSLVLGAVGNRNNEMLPFRMDKRALNALRSLSIVYFLAAVGLQAGGVVLDSIREHGLMLVFAGLITAFISELAGFFIGWRLWHINWILLSGAICGAMTSTPGLGAAIDACGSEDAAAGYGAAYPIAVFCMVFFASLMHSYLISIGY